MKSEHHSEPFSLQAATEIFPPTLHPQRQTAGRILMVTSSVHGEGVSTIAKRLAQGVAERLGDAIVIDTNLRGSREAPPQAPRRRPGFTEVLMGAYPIDSVIDIDAQARLHTMPPGSGDASASALLASHSATQLIAELRQAYRWTLLDVPPVSLYPDAAALSRFSDGVILVVRAERTRAEVVDQARRTITRCGGTLLGAIMNRRQHHIPDWLYHRI